MARPMQPVKQPLARQLQTAARRERAAQVKAGQAKAVLAACLAEARAEGLSVSAISEASGLSPKRIRVLLRGVGSA
jgi:hypothetical protein